MVIIGEDKYIDVYRHYLEDLKIDLSDVIHPKELNPSVSDIYNHYLLKRADAVIVITDDDEFNFYIAKLCKEWYKIAKVIPSINNSNNRSIFAAIGINDVIDVRHYISESLNEFLDIKE